jgi:LytS/YehU family sensor histidine kinase
MKALIYFAVIVGLVPVQSVLLSHISLWGVKPDLGLVAVCLIGLLGGELDGLLVGLALGWAMSLFSAQDLISSAVIKGAVGFLAGLAGRQVVNLSPVVLVMGLLVVSCLAGLVTPFALKLSDQQDLWWAAWTVVLPQACLDAVIGGAIYWLMWSRLNIEQLMSESRM